MARGLRGTQGPHTAGCGDGPKDMVWCSEALCVGKGKGVHMVRCDSTSTGCSSGVHIVWHGTAKDWIHLVWCSADVPSEAGQC